MPPAEAEAQYYAKLEQADLAALNSNEMASGKTGAVHMLCVIDEYSRQCLAIRVERKLNSKRVLETLADLFVEHGPPEHIRSDNGPEFIATALRDWLGRLEVKTLYIAPGSPWENGYCESFNSKLRDEFLDREVLYTLKEAQVGSVRGTSA